MSIFDMFKPAPVAPVAPTPGNIPAPTAQVAITEGSEPNGVVPVTPVPAEPVIPAAPLDKFKDIWDTVPTDPNAPAPVEATPLTASSLQAMMKDKDFTQNIDPATLADIAEGGDKATAALPAILNAVAQQVMVQSTLVNNKLTEKAVSEATAAAEAAIPDLLRQQTASNHLRESNPAFSNPVLKPFIESSQAQFMIKHPNATPAELTAMTTQLMGAIQETFAPPAPVDKIAENETDWNKFLGGDSLI